MEAPECVAACTFCASVRASGSFELERGGLQVWKLSGYFQDFFFQRGSRLVGTFFSLCVKKMLLKIFGHNVKSIPGSEPKSKVDERFLVRSLMI